MKAIGSLSRRSGTTLFMSLMAICQTLLHRYSGQAEFAVGTPVEGRSHPDTENLIGPFLNTVVVRADFTENPTFSEVLAHVRETVLDALTHRDVPFEKIVAELNPRRDPNRPPLFQVMLVLHGSSTEAWELPGVTLQPLELENATSKFDLVLAFEERADGLDSSWKFDADLFDANSIRGMQESFLALCDGAASYPTTRVTELPLLTVAEQRRLRELRSVPAQLSARGTLDEMFEDQARRRPDAVAVVADARAQTYGGLLNRSRKLAARLTGLGVGAESRVGLFTERSLEMVEGIMGILKAGGAYVPSIRTPPASASSSSCATQAPASW